MTARYAIYLAPEPGSLLDVRTAAWLGRDLAGNVVASPIPPGLTVKQARDITEAPRRYGFHATLKPPFSLVEGRTEDELLSAVATFCGHHRPFTAPVLHVRQLGEFLALVPSRPDPGLAELAAACVRCFDPFREPPGETEIGRRRAAGLTPSQERNLIDWGYPYVMEDFRFHMTLTGRIADRRARTRLAEWLENWLGQALAEPLRINAVAVYSQPSHDAPFVLRKRSEFVD